MQRSRVAATLHELLLQLLSWGNLFRGLLEKLFKNFGETNFFILKFENELSRIVRV